MALECLSRVFDNKKDMTIHGCTDFVHLVIFHWFLLDQKFHFSLIHESLDQIRTSSKPKLSSMAEIEFLYLAHRVKLQLSSKLNYYLFSKLLRKKSIFGRYISLYVKVNSKIVSRNDESFLVNG